MGWLADRIGVRRTVMFGAVDDRAGLAVSAIGTVWALYHRARAAARAARQRRDVPAAPRLCQPLVRAAARHRARLDRLGPIHRRHGVAERLRASDGALWLAGDDDRLRHLRGGGDPADRGAVPAPAARAAPACRGRRSHARRSGMALGLPPNLVLGLLCDRRVLLLRADGAAAEPPRRLLQRYRHSRRRKARRCCR